MAAGAPGAAEGCYEEHGHIHPYEGERAGVRAMHMEHAQTVTLSQCTCMWEQGLGSSDEQVRTAIPEGQHWHFCKSAESDGMYVSVVDCLCLARELCSARRAQASDQQACVVRQSLRVFRVSSSHVMLVSKHLLKFQTVE